MSMQNTNIATTLDLDFYEGVILLNSLLSTDYLATIIDFVKLISLAGKACVLTTIV